MKTGLSKIRNRAIAEAFSYMDIVEVWGSGIPKMFREAYEYGICEPELIDMGSDFRVNLYRKPAEVDRYGVISPRSNDTKDTNDTNDTAILNIIRERPKITQKELAAIMQVSLVTVKRRMFKLQEIGLIQRRGSSRKGTWTVTETKTNCHKNN